MNLFCYRFYWDPMLPNHLKEPCHSYLLDKIYFLLHIYYINYSFIVCIIIFIILNLYGASWIAMALYSIPVVLYFYNFTKHDIIGSILCMFYWMLWIELCLLIVAIVVIYCWVSLLLVSKSRHCHDKSILIVMK